MPGGNSDRMKATRPSIYVDGKEDARFRRGFCA